VFLSSHLLSEVEALCTRVGIVDRGRLVAQDQLEVLCAPTGRTDVRTPDVDRARAHLGAVVDSHDAGGLLVRTDDPGRLNSSLVASGITVTGLAPERRTLEDVVLELTSSGTDRVV
jgi:ABC-type multidrug transport system ATPase subunit